MLNPELIQGERCTTQDHIMREIRDFYIKLMGSSAVYLPMVDKQIVNSGPKLKPGHQQQLGQEITSREIKDALFSMNSFKAPGIDGFNAYFLKKAWGIIGDGITEAIKKFFHSGFMPRTVNSTLLALVPKHNAATTVKDYRPIACCTILYKIISKVLANRLQLILGDLISDNQSAFVKGRSILDNIIISHELVQGYSRKNISPRCMIKIDIQKAYDSVEWPFLKYLMIELGFPSCFVQWIMACVTTVSYSVGVNGDISEAFQAKKGLRQGDPISPYLFVLCMEYLHRCLSDLPANKSFKYHPKCKKFGLVHICFADDLLLFAKGDVSSVRELMRAFDQFSSVSGLKANPSKSCIYFGGVHASVQEQIINEFGMEKGELPFRYLGVPLSTKKLSVMQCQPLIQKITDRISCWSSKFLSYAGRIQLIKSVLFSMQTFWSQIFLVPKKVLAAIQTICRTFLWTGDCQTSRRALVNWEQLCLPKSAGGWNIVNIFLWNKAAIGKLLWCLAQKKDRIWVRWVHGYYIKHKDLLTMPIPQQASWMVRKIIETRKIFVLEEQKQKLTDTNYSIRKCYLSQRGEFQKLPWHKIISNNSAPPKCVFVTWLTLMGRLSTCDRLRNFGVDIDLCCSLCERTTETLNHLYFQCVFSRLLLASLIDWCGIEFNAGDWSMTYEFLVANCGSDSGKQKLVRLVFTVVIYQVWIERNNRKFKGICSSIEKVERICKFQIVVCCSKDKKLARILSHFS